MLADKLVLGGFQISRTTAPKLAEHLLECLQRKHPAKLFFANTNFIVKCRSSRYQMHDPSVIIVNDGVGIDIGAWFIHRSRFKENLNGTDFTPYLLRQAARPLRLFLLGGEAQVLDRAAEYARHKLGQLVVGTCDGYAGMNDNYLSERIARSQADLLLVGLGNPIQEQWILQHHESLKVPLVMGVGALFDFWADAKPRAPQVMQRLRLEWLYRLWLEPRRLFRRYTVDIVRFLIYCHRYRSD